MHKLDFICVSESYFNSETFSSDDNLSIPSEINLLEIDVGSLHLL